MATFQENIDDKQAIGVIRRLAPKLGLDVPDFGTEVGDKRIFEELVSYKRKFETNTMAPLDTVKHIESLTDLEKQNLGTLFKRIDDMPAFYEEGGTGYLSALKDYGYSMLSDPANLIGVAAGAITMGTMGAPVRATLGGASIGTRTYALNKLKAAFSRKALASTAATFGTESAAGAILGGYGEGERITAKEQIGVIDKLSDKEKYLQQAKVAVLEGPGSVLAGNVLSFMGSVGVKGVDRLFEKTTGKSLGERSGMQWIKNKFLPKSAHDSDAMRLTELNRGEMNELNARAQVIDDNLRSARLSAFKGREQEGEQLVNKALEGNSQALAKLPTTVRELVIEGRDYVKTVSDRAIKDTKGYINKDFITMLRGNINDGDYLRREYEVFKVKKGLLTSGRAQSFRSFLKENPTTISQVIEHVQKAGGSGRRWFDALNEVDKKGINQNILFKGSGAALEREATKLAKNLYQPREGGFKIQGNLKTRQKLPQFQKKLWGENYTPDQRITSTIAGINDVVQKTKFGAQLSKNLLQREIGVKANDKLSALEKFRQKGMNVKEVVRVSGEAAQDATDTLIRIESGRLVSDAPTVWIPKEIATPLKNVTDMYSEPLFNPGAFSTLIQTSAKMQGTLKVNMTALNPVAHGRNFFGMTQAAFGSGNLPRAGAELVSKIANTGTFKADKDFLNAMKRMGVTSTSVDIEQMLTRLGRDLQSDPTLTEKLMTFGIAALPKFKNKSVYKGALKFYQYTDDLGKMIAYVGEKSYQKSLWDSLPDAAKAVRRERVDSIIRSKGRLLKDTFKVTGRKLTDDEIISELAAQEVLDMMPVYTRVPPILEDLRGLPLIGNFTAFPAEVFRNVWNITEKGIRELNEGYQLGVTTEAGRKMLARSANRLASVAAMGGLATVTAHIMNEAAGYTGEKLEALRPFLPPWLRYGSVVIKDIDDEGNIKYTDLGYQSAYDPVISTFAPMVAGILNGESPDDLLKEYGLAAASNFLSPYTDPSLTAQGAMAIWKLASGEGDAREFRTLYRSWSPKVIRDMTEAAQRAGAFKDNEILGVEMPFDMKDIETVLYPKYFKEQYDNPDLDIGDFMSEKGYTNLGFTTQYGDLKTSTGFALNELYENSTEEISAFRSRLNARLTDPNAELPVEDLAEEYEDALRTQFAAQEEAMKLYEDLNTIMGDRNKASKIFLAKELKAGPNIFKHTITSDPISDVTTMYDTTNMRNLNDTFLRNIPKYGKDKAIQRRHEYLEKLLPELQRIHSLYNNKRLKESLPVED